VLNCRNSTTIFKCILLNIINAWAKIVAHLLSLVFQSFKDIICPRAGLAFTFLLDKKSKQKNQENLMLPPTFQRRPAPNFLPALFEIC